MKRSHVVSLVMVVIALVMVGSASAAIVVGEDTTTLSAWHSTGAYGTEGYVLYGIDAPDGDWTQPYDASSLAAADVVADSQIVLPSYISDISLAANDTGRWSGNGNYGTIEDPADGDALTNTPVLAWGGQPYVFTITRTTSGFFRLAIMLNDGDGADHLWDTSVDDGVLASIAGVATNGTSNATYHVYEIAAGDDPITVSVTRTAGGGNPGGITGFAFENILYARNLVPVNGAIGVDINPTLTWTTGEDPANPGNPNPAIVEHQVYFGTDPNLSLVATIPVANPAEYSPATLDRDTTYYWRIDEKLNDASIFGGSVQSFETLLSVPVIDPPEPQRTLVNSGESAAISVIATNPFTGNATGLTYQWKKYVDGVNDTPVGTNADTLTIDPVDASSEGYYYCTVTIASNGDTGDSIQALVAPRRILGQWPLDGDANDASGNGWNNTNPDSSNTWGAGVTGLAGDLAADFDASDPNDFINVGNVPVAATGEMTVSAWVQPRDITQDWAGIVSKWGETEDTFWVGQHATDGMLNYSTYLPGEVRNNPSDVLVNDTWLHIICTFSGVSQRTYIDGLLAESVDVTVDLPVADGDLLIGQVPTGSLANYFNGLIDDVTVYNYAVTAQAAADIYLANGVNENVCIAEIAYDFDNDCQVTLSDFAIFADAWLECQRYPECLGSVPEPVVE